MLIAHICQESTHQTNRICHIRPCAHHNIHQTSHRENIRNLLHFLNIILIQVHLLQFEVTSKWNSNWLCILHVEPLNNLLNALL